MTKSKKKDGIFYPFFFYIDKIRQIITEQRIFFTYFVFIRRQKNRQIEKGLSVEKNAENRE